MFLLGDESLYLNDDGIYMRELIKLNHEEYLQDEYFENKKYAYLINIYKKYISKVSDLVHELEIKNNQISTIQIISHLLLNGVFSYNNSFEKGRGIKDILISRNGLNIINGIGCCRNVSAFLKDVIEGVDEFPCVISNISDKHLAKEREVNHTINLIYYNGIPYGFDAYNNGNLYKMISEFEMVPFNEKLKYYIYYKPYYDMIYNGRSLLDIKQSLEYYKQVCGNHISKEEFEEILKLTKDRIKNGEYLVKDFKSDTKNLLCELKCEIEEKLGRSNYGKKSL